MDEKDLNPSSSSGQETQKPPQPPSELDILKAERDEYLNGWKRAKADLVNFQKDETRRLEDMAKYGTEALIKEVISAIASFEFALQTLEKAGPVDPVRDREDGSDRPIQLAFVSNGVDKGIYMIKSQLEDILKRRGVEKMKIAVGEAFNPLYHEAIGMVEPSEGLKSDTIAEEVDAGYTMHGRVIKVSKVKVVK